MTPKSMGIKLLNDQARELQEAADTHRKAHRIGKIAAVYRRVAAAYDEAAALLLDVADNMEREEEP